MESGKMKEILLKSEPSALVLASNNGHAASLSSLALMAYSTYLFFCQVEQDGTFC